MTSLRHTRTECILFSVLASFPTNIVEIVKIQSKCTFTLRSTALTPLVYSDASALVRCSQCLCHNKTELREVVNFAAVPPAEQIVSDTLKRP